MAEIKSTLEKVMERVAKIQDTAASKEQLTGEEKSREGMRQAAGYMRGEIDDLTGITKNLSQQDIAFVMEGMVKTLLRNIVLPRDEESVSNTDRAIEGLANLGQGGGDLHAIFPEMKKVLQQYSEHKKQIRTQLEESFASQVAQMEQALAKQTGVSMKIDPSHHPKFQEEWARIQGELKSQYSRALDQYKKFIEQKLLS